MKTTKSLCGILIITTALLVGTIAQGAQFSALNLPPILLVGAASDPVNNTYVLGTFTNTVVIGGQSYSPYAGITYLLARYRPDGTVGWAIRFGTSATPGAVTPNTTLTVTSNAVYVTGETLGSIHIVDVAGNAVNSAYNPGNRAGAIDGFLFRFSLAGVSVWQASVTGTSAGDAGRAVAPDAAGNIYWVGFFNGCCPTSGGATLTGGDGTTLALNSPSYGTAFLAKLSPAGTPLWAAKAYNRDTEFDEVTVDSSGGVYVAGYTRSWSAGTSTTVVSANGTTSLVNNPGLVSHLLVKFNSAGVLQWSVPIFGTPGGNVDTDFADLYALSSTTGDDLVIAGRYSSSTVTFSSTDGVNKQLAGGTGYDGFVARYASDGKAKWAVEVGGASDQVVSAISAGTSDVWVGGTTAGGISMPGIVLTGLGAQDAFVLRVDATGQVVSGSLLGGTNSDSLASLQVSGNDLGLVAGNEGGNFVGLGVQISNVGPFLLTTWATRAPWVSLIKAVKPSFSNLTPGVKYQLQASLDLNTWYDQGLPFTADSANMEYPWYYDVDNWSQVFFRLHVVP